MPVRKGRSIFWFWLPRALRVPRPPDFIIGGVDNPYIRRWWIIPRNNWFNIYLHNQVRDDDDRALHDHPWFNVSIILKGGYIEWKPLHSYKVGQWPPPVTPHMRHGGQIIARCSTTSHRLQLHNDGNTGQPIPSWSLFITGRRRRAWGFWCLKHGRNRWVHWEKFTDPNDTGRVGKGCDA